MNLVHAASSYPLYPGDSTAPFMEEMLRAIAELNHEVAIVVPRVDHLIEGSRQGVTVIGAPYAPSGMQVWGHGRSLNQSGGIRPLATAMTPLAMVSMAMALRARIRRHPPDVVHLHWVLPQGLLAAALPQSVPIVVSIHGADARFVNGRLQPMIRRVLARADAVIAASSTILDYIVDTYPPARIKSQVIPHGANDELFRQRTKSKAREGLGIDQSHRVVLGVGRLVRKKGFHNLIRSMEHLKETGVHLFIAGEGPERQSLTECIPFPHKDRVHLIGEKSRDEIAEWFAASDVVAVPSIPDGNDVDSGPVVLMEALASGKPVVATRIGMAPDVIDNGVNGILIDSYEPAVMAEALTRALSEADQMGGKARERFDQIGNWSRVAVDLEAVYGEAIEHRRLVLRGR